MMKRFYRVAASLALGLLATAASGEQLVAEYQGSGNKTTAEFTVKAPWILDWRINSDYNKMISFDLDLIDGTTGVLIGNIKSAKQLGNGVSLFDKGGKYRFRINGSFIRWHLKVKELTPAEAKLYTPR
jgi:hypothetical protein